MPDTLELNWLDRAIGWAAPNWAFRRAQARVAIELLNAYEGARTGRRTEGWNTSGSDANTAIALDLPRLRDRSRDLVRNTPEGKRTKKTIVTSAIGTGIIPEPDTDNKKLNDEIRAARDIHIEECDADGQLDYFGIQELMMSGVFESGETIVRRRFRRASDGLWVPLQYQVLESDHIDSGCTTNTHGGVTTQGIERNAIRQRAGYWLFPVHPGSSAVNTNARHSYISKFYDASEIAHVYCKERPGQERGVPWLHPVITLMREMDEYADADIMRAKIAACLALFVKQIDGGPETMGPATTMDKKGNRIEKMRPGMILYGRPGEEATAISPPQNGDFAATMRWHQHRLAYAVGMFYAQLTGDLSAVNWASYRAGDRDFRGVIESVRWLTLIPMGLRPMWRWFIDAAYLSGRISRAHYGVKWTPPQFMSVNPIADAQADEFELANGGLEWGEMNRRRGNDPEKQYESIKDWQNRFDRDGVVFAWDRRKVNASGTFQQDGTAQPAQR